MSTLAACIMVTADGRHEGPAAAFDFWNVDNDEFEQFSIDQLGRVDTIVFGRRTFEGMADHWSSTEAAADSPRVAELMNGKAKIVVSRTMTSTRWQPTTIVDTISHLGSLDGDALVLGSSHLVSPLAQEGLLGELRLMVHPVAIGAGTPALQGLTARLVLDLRDVDRFDSGNVLLTYRVVT